MLWLSLGLSLAMVIVTNLSARISQRLGLACVLTWGFALLGLFPYVLPTFLFHVLLLGVAGLILLAVKRGPMTFLVCSLGGFAVSYGVLFAVATLGIGNRHDSDNSFVALQKMHDKKVNEFVESDGFGRNRRPEGPGPDEGRTIPVDSSYEDEFVGPRLSARDEQGLSFLDALAVRLHKSRLVSFGQVGTVAEKGKEKHPVGAVNPMGEPLEGEASGPRWRIKKLELVGLLVHEQPVVYLTDDLPRMAEVREAKTRVLDPFEANGVSQLKIGKDLYVQEMGRRVRMIGSIRAGQKCLTCHEVKRGDLLGAFTYELMSE